MAKDLSPKNALKRAMAAVAEAKARDRAAREAAANVVRPTLRHDRRRPKAQPEPEAKPLEGKTMLETIVVFQMGRCLLCGGPLTFSDPETGWTYPPYHVRRPTFEHVVAKSRGGENVGNRLAAHRKCNGDKADRRATGCELVWLDNVNARLGLRLTVRKNRPSELEPSTNHQTEREIE